jgi:16S rRNA (cytidine1402-2'-O)-methyltransferase
VALADFPAERFAFVGFLPRKRAERRRMLDALAGLSMALVVFEAPHRIRETLADLAERLGSRRALLVRELTKVHEQVLRGTAAEIGAALGEAPRGEVTLVIEGTRGGAATGVTEDAAGRQGADRQPPELLLKRLVAGGLSRRDVARVLELVYAMPSRTAYKMAIGEE